MNVGFLGLGHMGARMAANLVKAGHDMTVYNRDRDKTRALAEHGTHAASTIGEACQGQVVVTMLADDAAVESVVLDSGGVRAHLRPGAIHISMSTISVALADRLAAAHAEAGQRFVAAPVFGRPEAAAEAKLFIVAAGAQDAITEVEPLLSAMGQRTFRIGERPSAANLVKLSGNFLMPR